MPNPPTFGGMVWNEATGSYTRPSALRVTKTANPPHEGPESKLHEFIREDCERRRWLIGTSRFGVRSTYTPGWPDFTILADGPKVFFIEVKKKGEKLDEKQAEFRHIALGKNHLYATVFSKEDYLQFVEGNL